MNAVERIIRSEDGFSTGGVVIALLITLSLIFTAAQVYQLNSAAATIQNVADAAALAAENEVAEFYVIAKVCDAVILSLSLTGVAAIAIGVVASCIPPTAALGKTLMESGHKILEARNSFAEKAAAGLNKLQGLLPFISAANANALITANSGGSLNLEYSGLAVLLPFEGEEITVGSFEAAESFAHDAKGKQEEIAETGKKAEEAAEKARKEKERAFLADCGNAPGYCMYERAQTLSALSAQENPRYHSVDTWSFSVALERARAYYPKRLAAEVPRDSSVESQADSALRMRFYTYAIEELQKGYVEETESSFKAYFPLLPKNTDEMRRTVLYTEARYPTIVTDSGDSVMHAWEGCPGNEEGSSSSLGSLAQMDSGGFTTCDHCEFTVSSFGKIAAATSSIEVGFEFHYRIVAEAALAYEKARAEYEPHARELKELTEGLFEQAKEAFSEAVSYRISIDPPGKFGAVALVASTHSTSTSTHFASHFVNTEQTLGAQVALSAATLVDDSSEDGATVISSLLDGIVQQGDSGVAELADGLLDMWSGLLFAYTKGSESLEQGVAEMLGGIPLMSESGLGSWAAGALSDTVEALGFAPVDLDAPKPVVVNSGHVLAADDSSFATGLLQIKQSYLSYAANDTGDLLSSAVSALEMAALESIDEAETEIIIASIELFGEGGISIPLTVALPPAIKGAAKDLVSSSIEALRNLGASVTGVRRWE